MCSPLWFPFLRTWCLLEAPWKGGVVERICSAASEHPPTLWKEINATYSTPLPFKVWAMCHNISMTLEVIRNTVSKALPQTSCRIRICSLTKFQRISLHTEIWEALHTLLPIQPELSLYSRSQFFTSLPADGSPWLSELSLLQSPLQNSEISMHCGQALHTLSSHALDKVRKKHISIPSQTSSDPKMSTFLKFFPKRQRSESCGAIGIQPFYFSFLLLFLWYLGRATIESCQ